MTYRIVFEEKAINRLAGFLVDDPEGVRRVLDAADALAEEPRPTASFPFGSRALKAEADRAPTYAERWSDHAPVVVSYDV